ncbi:MAG: TonB family protein [Ferruginibacter sp.]
MDAEKKHIIYSAEDIQKYFSGKLGPAEMHAMERAALDDAFLAEAMEGYEGMQQQDLGNILTSLKTGLSKKQSTKVISIIPAARFGMWKAAAAVLVICSGIALTFILIRNKPAEIKSIAAIKKSADSTIGAAENMPLDDPGIKPPKPTTENSTSVASEKPQLVLTKQKPSTDSAANYRSRVADKEIAAQDTAERYTDDRQKGKNEVAVNQPSPGAEQQLREQKELLSNKLSKEVSNDNYLKQVDAMNNKFVAKVLSPDGEPLPFANIRIPDENFGTYSDAKGNFRLVSSDSLLKIEVKSVGYNSRSVVLKSNLLLNKIVLSEDEQAFKDKVVVTSKAPESAKKRKSILEPSAPIEVEPEDGWENYDTYITNNLALPNSILKRNIHGEVEVSFEVQSDGALSNLKIDKSLGADCDNAALRVIKEGPRWKINKGNKATGKVKVRF